MEFWIVKSVFALAENLHNLTQSVASGFSPRQIQFDPMWNHILYVVDKVALGQIFTEYVRIPCQISLNQLLYIP
jgi:hypothetical protein